MRIFLGIGIPDEIKCGISEKVSSRLQKKAREARIVPPENLHVTVKFIGEITEKLLLRACVILRQRLEKIEPFTAEVKGSGFFPDEKNPRIFWVGMDSGGKLKKLNKLVEKELQAAGICKVEKRFTEHITIARFKSRPKSAFLKELSEKNKEEIFGAFHIKDIEVVKSELKPNGPVYSVIQKIPLKGV